MLSFSDRKRIRRCVSTFIDLDARDYEVISGHLRYQWRLQRSRVLDMASSYLKVLWDEWGESEWSMKLEGEIGVKGEMGE